MTARTTRTSPTALRAATLLALLGALLVLLPGAQAHASPLEAYPPRDGHLSERPQTLWAVFSEELDPAAVRFTLLDENLEPLPLPAPLVQGARVTYSLPEKLAEGGYVVQWSAADAVGGHLVSGAWSFAVGQAALPDTPPVEAPFSWPLAVAKYVGYAGLALLCAAVVARVHLLDAPERAPFERRLRLAGVAGGVVLLAAALAYFLAQAAHVGAAPLAYAASPFGRTLLLRVALAAAVLAWFLAHRPEKVLGWHKAADVASVLLVAFTYGVTGHTAAAFPEFGVGAGIATLHVASTIAWTGGLAALAFLLRSEALGPVAAKRAGKRFSGLAGACVAVMGATGVWMMLGALGGDVAAWGPKLATPYGALLGAMIVLGLVMMALGGASRFLRLKAFLAAPDATRRAKFRSNVSREAVLGVVVLVAAAGGTTLSPPAAADPAMALTLETITAECAPLPEPGPCYTERLQQVQAARGVDVAFAILEKLPYMFNSVSDGGSGVHSLGHELGRDNFVRHGNIRDAVAACSGAGLQACLHGSIQEYFERAGEVTPEMAVNVCDGGAAFSDSFCIHGVGHGVLLALNYSLTDSLAICDAFTTDANRSSCYSGALMENMDEYARHNAGVEGHSGLNRAVVNASDPLYPCNAIGIPYRQMCWIYQPQIMLKAVDYNVTRIAKTCESLPPEDNATWACYNGLGGYIGGAADYAPFALRRCAEMPSMGGHEMCIRGFVGTSLDNRGPKVGLAICRGAAMGQKQACYFGYGFAGRRVMPLGDLAQMCALAERGFDDECRMGAGLA